MFNSKNYKIFEYADFKKFTRIKALSDDFVKAVEVIYLVYKESLDISGNSASGHFIRVGESFLKNEIEDGILIPDNLREEGRVVGLLHDIVEDGKLTFADLKLLKFRPTTIIAVKILTRNKEIFPNYSDYITNILESNNELAIWTKYFDMKDNTSSKRVSLLSPLMQEKNKRKYGPELPRLINKIYELQQKEDKNLKRERVII